MLQITTRDFLDVGLAPGEETFLSTFEQAEIRRSFAEFLQISEQWIISFPWASFQPIPYPPRHDVTGRGKLPVGLNPAAATHPVWWLDDYTKAQGQDETDLAYGMRLWAEIQDRGLFDPADGPNNVLGIYLGWDINEPDIQDKIRRYMKGEYIHELATLEFGPRTEPSEDDPNVYSRQAHEQMVSAVLAPRLEILRRAGDRIDGSNLFVVGYQTDILKTFPARFEKEYRTLGERVTTLQTTAAHGCGRMQILDLRHDLSQAVENIVDLLCGHYLAAEQVILTDAVAALDATSFLTFEEGLEAHTEAVELRYKREAAGPIGRIYDNPADPAGYQDLRAVIDSWYEDAVKDGQAVTAVAEHYIGRHASTAPTERPVPPAATSEQIETARAWLLAPAS